MAGEALTKSYVNTHDPDNPVQDDLTLYKLFERARDRGVQGEIYNLETKERTSTLEVLAKANEYAKGLLSLGLVPGEDTLAVIGCTSEQSYYIFTACCSIGIGFAHPYIYDPQEASLMAILPVLQCKVVVVGEANGGQTCSAFLEMFDKQKTSPISSKLPLIEHVFYDNTYKDREPEHKFLSMVGKLADMGRNISDEVLEKAKENVKPGFALHHFFSSGSTGKPKCIVHSQKSLANEILLFNVENMGPAVSVNTSVDDLNSYALISLTMAGKVSKVVLLLDLNKEESMEEIPMTFTQAVIDEGVTFLTVSGTVQSLIKACIRKTNMDFPAMRVFLSSGQLCSRGFKESLMDVFKGLPFTLYGMSEAITIAYTTMGLDPIEHEARLEAKLYPKRNIELRIANEHNEPADIGVDGEVQLKTYSRMIKYKGMEQKTKEAFTEDGFFKTGDMGVMFPDGRFILKGRMADAIRFKIFGDVVYPGPIEEAMSTHPAIADISVVAASVSDVYGDEMAYCIRPNVETEKLTEDDIIAYGAERGLDDTHRPCRIFYFDKFPATANARKISKLQLRDQVQKMIENNPKAGMCQWFEEFLAAIS